MKIHLIANDGSPLKVTPPVIDGRGVGGAELAMMTLMQLFADRGHEVEVYNDPDVPGVHGGVLYRPRQEFVTEAPRDILIIFRSPNPLINFRRLPKNQKIIWWSTDQHTVGNFAELASLVHHIVTISPFHKAYFAGRYGIDSGKMGHIDLPVRLADYDAHEVERVPKQLIFCSIPDRGLDLMQQAWHQIKESIPEAKLIITSDYTLWGNPSPGNHGHRLRWAMEADIEFVGNVPRSELVKYQLQSEIHSYPCTYEELFCISAAECQVAGAYPFTSTKGALETTNQFGTTITGDPHGADWVTLFSKAIINSLGDEYQYLERRREIMMEGARRRFSPDRIVGIWETLFTEGKFTNE